MPTEIRALNDVDYALDVTISADEMKPLIEAALKRQRAQMNLKGFRPGKVPMNVVRKMVGPQVSIEVAEQAIGEAYRTAVADNEEIDPLGQPRLTDLDYDVADPEANLKATVQFGIRPEITLADLSGVPVTKVVRAFTDEDVDTDLKRRQDLAATEEDAPEGTTVSSDHVAMVDIQPIDSEGTPSGVKQNAARIVMANPDLRPEMIEALTGLAIGDEAPVELGQMENGELVEGGDVDRYMLTVVDIMDRVVPEVDEDFIRSQTGGKTDSLDDLKVQIREDLERSWTQRANQSMEQKMVEQFVLGHRESVQVPDTLAEAALDTMLADVRQQQGGDLPPTFDFEAWREQNKQQAEDQVRWLLIKDALIEQEKLEVTNEDFEAEFAKLSGEGADSDLIKQYFTSQPQLLEQMGDQLLNQRIFSALEARFDVVEKTADEIRKEAEKRRAEFEAAQANAPVELVPAADEAEMDEAETDDSDDA